MQSTPSPKRGFTLVELSIILIILFVVGLVIYPVYAGRTRKNIGMVEMSNQKQIALGFMMYVQDYDERFPPAASYITLSPNSQTFPASYTRYIQSWGPNRVLPDGRVVPGILLPYVRDNALFLDPHERAEDKGQILGFMYNDLLAYEDFKRVGYPAATVLITSAENRLENAGHALTPDWGPFPAVFNRKGGCDAGQGATVRSARLRNKGGTYFAFADGHVKWYRGGASDPVFFPPRSSNNRSSVDARTKKRIGPKPGNTMQFNGRAYAATFHID